MQTKINKQLKVLAKKFAGHIRKKFKNNVVSIILFGSVARGEANEYSDIDLLIIFEDLPAGRLTRIGMVDPIEEALEKDIAALRNHKIFSGFNYLLKIKQEARCIRPLYLDLTEDAVYLFDKGGFFKGIMVDMKRRLSQLGSRRERVGMVRYWELKPDIKPGEVIKI